MKKFLKISLAISALMLIALMNLSVFAADSDIKVTAMELSDDYKKYLENPNSEQYKEIIPTPFTSKAASKEKEENPINLLRMVGASYEPKFTLQNYIPKNLVIKNQGNLNICWAFASLGSLEGTLAYSNYRNNTPEKIYDFSERHLDYSSTREFLNNKINNFGFSRNPGDFGNWYMALNYLTNGLGAVDEKDMPMNYDQSKIDISKIQNKTVTATVKDSTTICNSASIKTDSNYINSIKQHIKTKGPVFALIYGASLDNTKFYNNETGALYVNDDTIGYDHAISIVGWDDDYSKNNFKSTPSSDGAWIIKNSWGSEISYTYADFKEMIFWELKSDFEKEGINESSDISDETIEAIAEKNNYKYSRANDKIYKEGKIGDNGFMYISYEDKLIYSDINGIDKATESKDYDNVYLYNELLATTCNYFSNIKSYGDIFIGNKYTKLTSSDEYINEVSFYTFDNANYSVYINPNSDDLLTDDSYLVSLTDGTSVQCTSGYHTLKLKKPLKINSDKFAVVIRENNVNSNNVIIPLESKLDSSNSFFSNVNMESGKCFTKFEKIDTTWYDLSKFTDAYGNGVNNGDSTIRVYTSNSAPVVEKTLQKIEVTKNPNKTVYAEGEDFDKSGMEVRAYYSDGSSEKITDYSISNPKNLTTNQNSLTISYNGFQTNVNITVNKKDETTSNTNTVVKNTIDDDNSTSENTPSDNDKEELKNSNLSGINAKVINMQYNSNNTEESDTITVAIEGIKDRTKNNAKYYFYLSNSNTSTDYSDKTLIENPKFTTDGFVFDISLNGINNYDEVSNGEDLYLYVIEVAELDGKTTSTVSNPTKLIGDEGNTEVVIGGVKVKDRTSPKYEAKYLDDTIANKDIPQTGVAPIITIISIISILGIIIFIRYKILKIK